MDQWKSGRAHGTPFIADFLAALAVGMRFIILENAVANGIGWAGLSRRGLSANIYS